MTLLNEYESRFERAAKARYHYEPVAIRKAMLVTDLDDARAGALEARARKLLRVIDEKEASPVEWRRVDDDAYRSTQDLVALIQAEAPDLVVTYRSLKEQDRNPVYSLGTSMDVLTQATAVPTLVLPHGSEAADEDYAEGTPQVMVITDHLTGDDRLVNWGVRFVLGDGDLYLTHVEDDAMFERFMEVVGKVPTIDTDDARRDIEEQLLREPAEFIDTCREVLNERGVGVKVHPVVKLGHRVREYRDLVDQHGVDLLVFNAKDEDQVAMHGLAYSLAVELKRLPLLLL